MKAEIISIGTELLLGKIVNTNAVYISRKLAELGIDLYYQTAVGDNPHRLTEALLRSLARSDIVITTGGLGPTVDDVTVETIARLTSRKLILNRTVLKDLNAYFRLRGLKPPCESRRQAYLPSGVRWVRNSVGTAPGLIFPYGDRSIIALPGPPREMVPLFEEKIIPFLKKRFSVSSVLWSRRVKITGLAESQVDQKVRELLKMGPRTTVGIYAKLGEVDLDITSRERTKAAALRSIAKYEGIIRRRLKDYIFGYDEETLEGTAGNVLTKGGKTIAVAESCTGGLLSTRLTDVSGSSKYFIMGVATYSNAAKVNILGVRESSLAMYGAVSRPVALEMAQGVRLLACADIGIGITGVAGPTGGTRRKPVGLVYIALAAKKKLIARETRFKGSRQEIRFQASQVALDMIRRESSS